MAAQIRKVVRAKNREFTVGEIVAEMVKSSSISPSIISKEHIDWTKRVSKELGRLVKKGEMIKVSQGVYRCVGDGPLQGSSNPVEDEDDFGRLKILRVIPTPVSLSWPLGLEEYILVYPGDLIVVAGATNAGKTAFFLNLAWLNWHLFPVKYLSSELSEVRLNIRLRKFCEAHGTSLDDWDQHVYFKSHGSNFAPYLSPAGLNVVDYLEIYHDFQEVGKPIKEIFRRQQNQPGITFMGLQMKHGNVLGRGGPLAMEKPFVYLTLDHFQECGLNRLVIEKAKDPARDDVDPNGKDFWFRIDQGSKFILEEKPKDATKLVEKARKEAGGGR